MKKQLQFYTKEVNDLIDTMSRKSVRRVFPSFRIAPCSEIFFIFYFSVEMFSYPSFKKLDNMKKHEKIIEHLTKLITLYIFFQIIINLVMLCMFSVILRLAPLVSNFGLLE